MNNTGNSTAEHAKAAREIVEKAMGFVQFFDFQPNQKIYNEISAAVIKRCVADRQPVSRAYEAAKGVWDVYWEEVRKEEQRRKDLGLERTHYMVE